MCTTVFIHLVVSFDALWKTGVYDEAHVGLVDAEAEGDGSAHELHVAVDPVLLHHRTLAVREARVIARGAQSLPLQRVSHLVAVVAREAVDDTRLARELRLYELRDVGRHVHAVLLDHRVAQIRPVERLHEALRIAQVQLNRNFKQFKTITGIFLYCKYS